MAVPGKYNITGYRGDTLSLEFTFEDEAGVALALPTTGWAAQIRTLPDSAVAVEDFTVDASGAAAGVVVASLTGAQTATLSGGVWDLEQTTSGVVRTYLRGSVTFEGDVTRA
jgi:hypothetical protein